MKIVVVLPTILLAIIVNTEQAVALTASGQGYAEGERCVTRVNPSPRLRAGEVTMAHGHGSRIGYTALDDNAPFRDLPGIEHAYSVEACDYENRGFEKSPYHHAEVRRAGTNGAGEMIWLARLESSNKRKAYSRYLVPLAITIAAGVITYALFRVRSR